MTTLSVCIPTYEMHGKGPSFLRESLERLSAQTFRDFDVVVSDNSTTDVIKAVCDEYAAKLDIKYFKNPDPKRGMSSNVNNAIRVATGAIIKILFLDDLLLDEKSLELVAANFDVEKDRWLVTGCTHTRDGRELFNPHVPYYNESIHLGRNTIGSPSVLAFKNENPLFFDERLKWLMDCNWYKRMHDAFGQPKVVSDIGVIIRMGDHQVTNTEVTKALIERERAYVEQKDRVKGLPLVRLPNVTLVAASGIDPERAAAALELSMLGVEYAEAILVSHRKPENLSDRITFKKCKATELASADPKNTDDYSRFIAYELASYVESDYALIVHHNAHVLNPDKWDPDFLNYDYIGAPWRPNRHFTEDGAEVRVGNGGFSLRSRKMLNALNELGLPFTDKGTGFFHEDGIICVYYRKELEAAGIKFAPVEAAAAFSHEFDVPESVAKPFGFHDYKSSSRFHRAKKLVRKIRRYMTKGSEGASSGYERTPAEIAEYRKEVKVYDVFNFFNELELLEIRLNILDPYVDFFVIVESTMTHSGMSKELYFENNKDRFRKFEHKIIHYVIREPLRDFDDAESRLKREDLDPLEREIVTSALKSPLVPHDKPHFLRDFYEKESVKHALVGLRDSDFCYLSDLDEIWNPDAPVDYASDAVYKFRQLAYYYYLNNRSSEPWAGTTAAKYAKVKNTCVNDLRSANRTRHTFVESGGWHFTYQGGADRVKQKIEAFSHQEFNNESTKSKISEKLSDNKDVVGRRFKFWTDESDLPDYLRQNKDSYRNLFK